ncbi:MAG: ATP synthase subunit I [Clostridium sp.]
MDSNFIDFIISKTKIFSIVSIFIASTIILFFGLNMGLNYYCGFFIGTINFILLSVGSYRMLDNAAGGRASSKFEQSLFFTFRYFLVASILVICIKYLDANVFALVIGLLTIHIALLITAIKNNLSKRKEG